MNNRHHLARSGAIGLAIVAASVSVARAQSTPSTDTTTLEPVVVTATRLPSTAGAATLSTTVISGDDLRARGVSTILEALRETPSVGIVQGGFVSAFADSAMGAASITQVRDRKVYSANAEMKISFFRPAQIGSTLTCTAVVVSGGKRANFVEAEVVDDDGRVIARASSTYMLSDRN